MKYEMKDGKHSMEENFEKIETVDKEERSKSEALIERIVQRSNSFHQSFVKKLMALYFIFVIVRLSCYWYLCDWLLETAIIVKICALVSFVIAYCLCEFSIELIQALLEKASICDGKHYLKTAKVGRVVDKLGRGVEYMLGFLVIAYFIIWAFSYGLSIV